MTIFEEHPDEIARFDRLLATEDHRAERMEAVEQAIRLAESLVARHPDDPDAHHCLGLAWHHFPGSSSWRSWHCRRALQRALALDPTHPFAKHYLACLFFDQERFADAAEILQQSSYDFWVERDQEWRALKEEE